MQTKAFLYSHVSSQLSGRHDPVEEVLLVRKRLADFLGATRNVFAISPNLAEVTCGRSVRHRFEKSHTYGLVSRNEFLNCKVERPVPIDLRRWGITQNLKQSNSF